MELVTVRGVSAPAIGIGAWQMRGDECRSAVERAFELGYRHVDATNGARRAEIFEVRAYGPDQWPPLTER